MNPFRPIALVVVLLAGIVTLGATTVAIGLARADGRRRESARHREHPDVDAQERDHEVASAVSREVDPEREQADGDQVDREHDELHVRCPQGVRRATNG